MAAKPREDRPVYLDHKGWFWVEWIGQRSIYHGPYCSQEQAERFKTDVDAYAAHGWVKP